MRNKKMQNPLIRRIPRELAGDWKKYLVVGLFLVLTIGFVSGMYVANGSMEASAGNGRTEYKREDGHFVLGRAADRELISAIETGEKADIRQYYENKAKQEFEDEFIEEFKSTFDSEFSKEFGGAFEEQDRKSVV